MAFIVEDGTQIVGANAYISEAVSILYHTDRGNTKWTDGSVTTAQRVAAIIRATDYVEKRFSARYRGNRTGDITEQGLSWPRTNALDDDGFDLLLVPKAMLGAVSEYALRALLCHELAPDAPLPVPKQDNTFGAAAPGDVVTGEVSAKREKVGPLEEETEYKSASDTHDTRVGDSDLVNTAVIPQYPAADLIIEAVLVTGNARVVRI